MKVRADRWRQDPGKDHRRALQVAPWAKTVLELSKGFPRNAEHARRLDEFRWLVEEFRVSVFAQELGTAQPASEKKLEQKIGEIRTAAALVGGLPPPAAPVVKPLAPAVGSPLPSPTAPAKSAKLTSFGDLGRMLGR
jgi:ATP-dependent helicase HrpA